ncbi:SDR family NAD(P)-dependent oxidoreductase [Tautonia plasticadhaerens]|uniref:3-oxoacyl-[acyl-carrier-protein] reductase FabG n=1 Tax=Tautonia plasticadhaerens TaxID=2527974 RepID=A0A518H1U0_9BACT|nr:SDR family oxidoreductase [Tautonia plasticadhaerens]QDV34792.1 3-oxoacyl-[acyl-carrier-protein] reductase FabG [Tautonia plasticadhaerens]
MDLQLEGKLAVVTGSTAGIGRAIASALAAEGATVVVNGRNPESVEATAKELSALGGGTVHGIVCALDSAEGVDTLITGAEAIGPVDILVNNVGIFEPKPFEEIPDEDWRRFFDVNVMSGVRCSRAVMCGMRDRGWGRILFISSESGINIPEEMVHYGMTKTAQLAIARGLAKALAGTGVTVNSLLPGPTWTEGVATFVAKMAEQRGTTAEAMKAEFVPMVRPSSLIRRFATPEEVAAHAAYLCSPLASATSGAAHRVEGGIVDICF